MNASGYFSTWVEVNLGAVEGNVRCVRERAHTQVMAIVKANAYGHGAIPVAQAAVRGGANWLGVARIEEALELRRAGMEQPILVMGFTAPGRFEEAIANRISLAVWEPAQLEAAADWARRMGEPARLHLKIDTGMGRLGVQPQEAIDLAARLAGTPGLVFEGVFTHFARADELQAATTREQEACFQEVIQKLETLGIRPPLTHAANSAAGLGWPETSYDLIRLGIALYGLKPSPDFPLPKAIRPALTWKTVLSQVKTLPAGRGVSYGHQYVTRARERIGTLPVGYADGFRRVAENQVLVGGRRAPVIGRVCMDQAMVQLDDIPEARAGDEVILIGTQGLETISAEEIAQRWGTINYEVVCGIGPRVPRIYFN